MIRELIRVPFMHIPYFLMVVLCSIFPEFCHAQHLQTEVIEGITMVSIPAGSFTMGSNDGADNEKPVHMETLGAFSISMTEVTHKQYRAITGINPSNYVGHDDLPVETVSWYDAIKFCNQLSDRAGFDRCYDEETWECDFSKNGFRLPTEAEWEYACRAGTTTRYNTGETGKDLDDAAWYGNITAGNSHNIPHPVAMRKPNAWGLYDMHGSLWEWCNDRYRENYSVKIPDSSSPGPHNTPTRVIRGGSWINNPEFCRVTTRDFYTPDLSYLDIGFRVVRSGMH